MNTANGILGVSVVTTFILFPPLIYYPEELKLVLDFPLPRVKVADSLLINNTTD